MALDFYNRAILEDPRNFAFAKEYGLYCEQLQQTAKAQEVLRQAYGINQRDPEVVAALQRIGVVPGPSLRSKADLAQPPLPKGPLPPWKGLRGRRVPQRGRLATPRQRALIATQVRRPPRGKVCAQQHAGRALDGDPQFANLIIQRN